MEKYDAFISYSRDSDSEIALAVRRGLHGLGRPWYKRRALRVFFDRDNMPASSSLPDSIRQAVANSRTFVLIASPGSAGSKWVGDEIEEWRRQRGPEKFFIVVSSGTIVWDDKDFSWGRTDALHHSLKGFFKSEPTWIDLRSLPVNRQRIPVRSGQFLSEVASLAAPIHGVEKDELIHDDRRRQRYTIQAVIAVVLVLLVLLGMNIRAQILTVQERDTALSLQLAAQSLNLADSDPTLSRLLAAQAWDISGTAESHYAMLAATNHPQRSMSDFHSGHLHSMDISRDGDFAVVSGYGFVRLWSFSEQEAIGEDLQDHEFHINSVSLSPDGTRVASGSDDGTVRITEVGGGDKASEAPAVHSKSVRAVVFSPDGSLVASGGDDSLVQLWDAKSGEPVGEPLVGHSHWITDLSFSPDGSLLASSDGRVREPDVYPGTVVLWDVDRGEQLGDPLHGHERFVNSVDFSPDGSLLASASSDGTIRLWDVEQGVQVGDPLHGNGGAVFDVSFDPSGTMLASGSRDALVRLWDVYTHSMVGFPLEGHREAVYGVNFHPGEKTLISHGYDGTIREWHVPRIEYQDDPSTFQEFDEDPDGLSSGLPNLPGGVEAVSSAESPNGSYIGVVTNDESVMGRELLIWSVHGEHWVGSPRTIFIDAEIIFSPGSGILVSFASDGIIELWDPVSGDLIARKLVELSASITKVEFDSDGSEMTAWHAVPDRDDAHGSFSKSTSWEVVTNSAPSHDICSNVHRTMSEAEVALYLPGSTESDPCGR